MSGIFGIIRLPGATVGDAELAPMAETLKHRGPDVIRYFARQNAGLGHCMLQSTPESVHETLPLHDKAAGLTITADARIDNREELLAAIPVQVAPGQVITDSQLILHAYRKWGEHCVDHLLGDFAFSIWDERANALFVARDHMGCKPFYYHCHDGLFVFASSAMAVARVPQVKATLNEGRVADYLVQELEGINKTCSWFNEISRMPPAQCGYFRNNTFQYRQYWTLEPADLSHLKTDDDYLEAFTEVYTQAVRCRLRCQTQPASMLSGGLDSSTIVALARDILVAEGRAPLRTYSGISEEGVNCPETKSIDAVVAQGMLGSTRMRPSNMDSYLDAIWAATQFLEDPFDSNCTLLSLMFLLAERDGCRVVVSGVDGEHAVGLPTNYVSYLLRQGKWLAAWNEAKGLSQHYWRGHHSPSNLFALALRSRYTPDFVRTLKRRISEPKKYRRLLKTYAINGEFARRTNMGKRLREYETSMRLNPGADLGEWHKHALQVPYLIAGIERYERLASYFAVETRHPLLDIRLLNFTVSLPWTQKARGGWSKILLRRLASQRLPPEVAWREGWEELGWLFLRRQVEQVDVVSNCLEASSRSAVSLYVDREFFRQNSRLYFGEDYSTDWAYVWAQYCLGSWLASVKQGVK